MNNTQSLPLKSSYPLGEKDTKQNSIILLIRNLKEIWKHAVRIGLAWGHEGKRWCVKQTQRRRGLWPSKDCMKEVYLNCVWRMSRSSPSQEGRAWQRMTPTLKKTQPRNERNKTSDDIIWILLGLKLQYLELELSFYHYWKSLDWWTSTSKPIHCSGQECSSNHLF